MPRQIIPGVTQVNPARAGMIPASEVAGVTRWGKPRASGDDPPVGLMELLIGR